MARLTRNRVVLGILLIVGIGVVGYFGWNSFAKKINIDAIIWQIPYINSENKDKDICVNVDKNAQTGGLTIRCFKPTEYAEYLATLPDTQERINELSSWLYLTGMKVTNFTDEPEHMRFIEKLQLGLTRDTVDFKNNPENAKIYGESYFSVRNDLLAISSWSLDRSSAIKLHFLRNFEGDFEKDQIALKRACREAKTLCEKDFVDFELSGIITNYGNQTLPGILVTLLGSSTLYNQEISAVSDSSGAYHLRGKIAPYSRLRFRASSNQTTPAYFTYSLIGGEGTRFSQTKDFKLFPILKSFEINTRLHTVDFLSSAAKYQYANETYSIDGYVTNMKMEIPEKAIVKRDGTPYIGKVSVFIPIKSSDQSLDADIFETELWYAGFTMEKPMQEGIIILGENNESLYISESHPIIITDRFEGGDAVMQTIPEKDFDTLVETSSGTSGYPIDSKFLSVHNLSSYPLHWNFDMVRGIWYETGVRVSEDGYTVSYPFFTLRNTPYFSDVTP